MSESMVTLSPRGWGRNALRTGDVLLGGQLPVVVYDDGPSSERHQVFRPSARMLGAS